jgi:hypothetical protein
MRLGESCACFLRGKCADERAPQHKRTRLFVGEQYYCTRYHGVVPRATDISIQRLFGSHVQADGEGRETGQVLSNICLILTPARFEPPDA